MRRGLVVVACVALQACGASNGEGPTTAPLGATPHAALDEPGWTTALSAATRSWGDASATGTSLAFVLDDHVQGASEMPLVRARVRYGEKSLTLGDESPRVVASTITPGTHALSFEVVVGGPPCYYCSAYVLRLSLDDVRIDVEEGTSVVVRVGATAEGWPTTPIEKRLRPVVEAHAWRRVSEENVAEIAGERIDRCIDHALRSIDADRANKDVIKLLCHKDKLERCELLHANVLERKALLLDARQRGDGELVQHQIVVIGLLTQKANDIEAEIPYCGGYQ